MPATSAHRHDLVPKHLRWLVGLLETPRDLDVEQAKLRVIIGGSGMLYTFYLIAQASPPSVGVLCASVAAATAMLAGLWMLWWFHRHTERTAGMRYFGICSDLIPLTIGVWGAGEYGVPVVGLYLWVTVGNGFRFGPRYLLFAYWLSLTCFTAVVTFVPFWRTHLGSVVGFMVVLTTIPIYTLVLLSRLTAQKDAALQLSNAKSRFVANVSHELRTPLTGIVAVYELLRHRRLSADEQQLLGVMGRSIRNLREAVDEVLQMSKLEAGAERAEMRPFNLRYFLSQMNVLARPQADTKGLAWALTVEPDVPSTVVGDPGHLQHILGNLINNAFKFTPKGSVTLRVSKFSGGVRFDVADTGIGIPLAKQERLFDRFVQADDSDTRKYGGTGLGTSIAHDLTLLMNGRISLSSAPGQGSTFTVELPLAEPQAKAAPSERPANPKVLVIGPESAERDTVVNLLTESQFIPMVEDSAMCPPPFTAEGYLGALLVMSAGAAAEYTDSHLRDRAGAICPWLVVTSQATSTQAAMLLKSGASGILLPTLAAEGWLLHLGALANRSNLPATEEAETGPLAATRELRILLADDHRSNQMLLARILEDAGHTVVTVNGGEAASDALSREEFDMALLDLNMPDISGTEVIALHRAGEAGKVRKTPMAILSADATAETRDHALAAGADDYLTKPVAVDKLLAMLQRLTAGTQSHNKSAESPVPRTTPVLVKNDYVNPQRIEMLRKIGGQNTGFLQQYLQVAIRDMEAAVQDLRGAAERQDVKQARFALHTIYGTAAGIGASALVDKAKDVRSHLLQPDPDANLATLVAELSSIAAQTKDAVTPLAQVA